MLRWGARRRTAAGSLVLMVALAACGGGGGGEAGADLAGPQLLDVQYGRLIDEASGPRVVSPFSVVETDPVTGRVVAGSLQTLSPEWSLDKLVSLGLGPDYAARVVPRNAVLCLRFNLPLDPASVQADVLDQEGLVLEAGSVQLRVRGGLLGVPVRLRLLTANVVLLDPVLANTVGLPPSPLAFGDNGRPVASVLGHLELRLPTSGPQQLRATDGRPLQPRADGLGEESLPIGVNPGNEALDFFGRFDLLPSGESFRGFLPDRTAPRIVRTHRFAGRLDESQGDFADRFGLTTGQTSFVEIARDGRGEWADALLTLRPGSAEEEQRTVQGNTRHSVFVSTPFQQPLADDDEYELTRAELFEPDPTHPIDPGRFDPDNPEITRNQDLVEFVEIHELDAAGQVVRGPIDPREEAIPPFSSIRVRFNEPMARSSFSPWETFEVQRIGAPGGEEVLSWVELSPDQTVATLRPIRHDRANGVVEVVGWAPGVQALELVLSTVPPVSFLRPRLGSDAQVEAFLARGERSLLDLGGQPLAFAGSAFDVNDPVIHYRLSLLSSESSTTLDPVPVVEDWGVIVHRFQGLPFTAVDPDTFEAGARFADQNNVYTPVPDFNMTVNGFLSGPPVAFHRKVHDDFNPPPDGQFNKFPNGVGVPLRSVLPMPNGSGQSFDGVRMQHVYRDIDASPGRELAGTILDLYRVSWVPIGGNVNTDVYEDLSIHAAHSTVRPITRLGAGGGAVNPFYGLDLPFDFDTWLHSWGVGSGPGCTGLRIGFHFGPNYYDELRTVLDAGTRYRVRQSVMFTLPESPNPLQPWPLFDHPFPYNNGAPPKLARPLRRASNDLIEEVIGERPWKEMRLAGRQNKGGDSLLLEYRIRPQPTSISGANGFTIAFAILNTFRPMYRAFSSGADLDGDGNVSASERLFPDQIQNDVRARCASGPNIVNIQTRTFGDNSRYFGAFDYVKTTAVITSPYVLAQGTANPDYFPPMTLPFLDEFPEGTEVTLLFSGSDEVDGSPGTRFHIDVSHADDFSYVAFRATLVGNVQTLLGPSLDLLAIPYRRP